jgi:hypothetical protein
VIERENLRLRHEQVEGEYRQALKSMYMSAFDAFAAAGLPLSQSPVDKRTPEEKLQAEITQHGKEVEGAEEDLENYIYFHPTVLNAYFRELEKRDAMEQGKGSEQVRDLHAQLSQWTEEEKAERFAPIFLERSRSITKRIATTQLALEAALKKRKHFLERRKYERHVLCPTGGNKMIVKMVEVDTRCGQQTCPGMEREPRLVAAMLRDSLFEITGAGT